MSEIKDALELAGWSIDRSNAQSTKELLLQSIASSLLVIARVLCDLDEVEEMYKDYPAGKKPTDSDWEKWRKNE